MTNTNKKATQATGGDSLKNNNNSYNSYDNTFLLKNQDNSDCIPSPNIQMAEHFLSFLDEDDESFTFQTFDDNSERKDPSLAQIFHGSLDEHLDALCRLQSKGAGVFVTVNKTDLKGRRKENITAVRAFFVDLDGSPLQPLYEAPITPNFIIQSSPDRYHAYYLIEDCPLEKFSYVQKQLASIFKGDPAVTDLSRVMRLPGFFHQKNTPFLTKIIEENATLPLSMNEFEKPFNITSKSNHNEHINDPIYAILKERRMIKKADSSRQGCYSVKCPWSSEHSTDDLGTKYYLAGYEGYTKPAFKCFHDHCKSRTYNDLVNFLGIESLSWEDPKSIEVEIYPVPEFDPDSLLPEPLNSFIMDEAERMPCAPDFVAVAVLAMLGSIIGARCAMKPKCNDDWLIIPNIWGAIVGLPSSKKSPAISAAFKPLHRLIHEETRKHQSEISSYEMEIIFHEAEVKAIKDQIKNAASNKDPKKMNCLKGEMLELNAKKPEEPHTRRYKTNDCTVEKLGELLRDNPQGILVERDELVGLLSNWEKEGREGDRAFFLESWNGNSSFNTDRIGRGEVEIPNLCTSIFGGIQPDKLTAYLEQAEYKLSNDGMLQRFQLLVYPNHRKWEWKDQKPNSSIRQAMWELVYVLSNIDLSELGAFPADENCKFPYFQFTEDALKIFKEWMKDLHENIIANEENPLIAQHLAKYDKLFPALALIFHIVDSIVLGYRGDVTKVSALRAATWCEYLEAHARRCYGLQVNKATRGAHILSKKISAGKLQDGFTVRDIARKNWRSLKDENTIQTSLDMLEEHMWVKGYEVGGQGPGSGRRTLKYKINPQLRKGGDSEQVVK